MTDVVGTPANGGSGTPTEHVPQAGSSSQHSVDPYANPTMQCHLTLYGNPKQQEQVAQYMDKGFAYSREGLRCQCGTWINT